MPAANEAVRPVTPVEATFCALYVPALPPVYEMAVLTPLAAVPLVSVPVVVAPAQLIVEIVAAGALTLIVKLQPWPPKVIAKLAVPALAGVPVMV